MADEKTWRCFHCDEVFTDPRCAALHFGKALNSTPICQLDPARVREMERELAKYRAEDTELHREIARLQTQHAFELRTAEEKGYERGLKDSLK